ncbi:MAG: ATP-binding protein [Rhodospirillaceae bacterium]|nr:ATP-binding protein [Rhodospirillaceae bacterium]MCY4237936.1 ATP-binding protein [Rhodospirillaceae bacterium]
MVIRRIEKTGNDILQLWSVSLGAADEMAPDILPVETGKVRTHHAYEAEGPFGKRLYLISYKVFLADSKNPHIIVASWPLDPLEDEVDNFGIALVATLGILALTLLVAMSVVIRYGLGPLRRVAPALTAIRSGEAGRLTDPMPKEVAPLADEVNALLDHNAQVVDRARTDAGNLAHALKTSLAVLQNEARACESELADKVIEQIRVMTESIEHHLARARMAAKAGVLTARTEVMPIMEGLARTLEKIHCCKNLTIITEGPTEAAFRGEKQDFEEALGNLLDNACRFASTTVRVTAILESGDRQSILTVTVEDDGPGLPQSQRRKVVKRGARLGQQTPGSGLGLSIVRDIAEMYDGDFDLAESGIGGFAARMSLPDAA